MNLPLLAVQVLVAIPALWLVAGAIHWIAFALVALVAPRVRPGQAAAPTHHPRIVVLVPAYKGGEEVVENLRALAGQDYPAERVLAIAILDKGEPGIAEKCRALGAEVLELSLERSTKVASLKAGIERARSLGVEPRTIGLILDADNLLAPGFLAALAATFERGFDAVQGRRVARNWQGAVASLDMVSEVLNNAVFRRGRAAVGLPCSLIGSAMAFRWNLLEEHLLQMDSVGGFDKELELRLLSTGARVGWAEGAVCFDEKLTGRAAFGTQKRRWISTQFVYGRRAVPVLLANLLTRRGLPLLDKWLQWIFPPRPLLVAGLAAMVLPSFFVHPALFAAVSLALVGTVAMHLALVAREGIAGLVPSLLGEFFALLGSMAGAALRVRGANKSFLHTPRTAAVGLVALAAEIEAHRGPLPWGVREAVRGVARP